MIKPKEGQIALIDMDGTIANYDGAIRRELCKLKSPSEPDLPEDIHNVPEWMENRMSLIKKQDGFWRNMSPIYVGLDILYIMEELGYSSTILTKGPNKTRTAWTEKTEWCDQHIPGRSIIVVDSDRPENHKGLVYGKVLFDDYPPYMEAWLKNRPRGKGIMLEHFYNASFTHPQVLKVDTKWTSGKIRDEVTDFLLSE